MKEMESGKYDDLAGFVRKQTDARCVVLMVVEGELGNGFSVQTDRPDLLRQLPAMLEGMASVMRGDPEFPTGARVTYRTPGQPDERGIVVRPSDDGHLFVLFDGDTTAKATPRSKLTGL